MGAPLEKTTEREFWFYFRKLNFFKLSKLYESIKAVDGDIVFVNAELESWAPDDGLMALIGNFSLPNKAYTARITGDDRTIEAYTRVFGMYPDYVHLNEAKRQQQDEEDEVHGGAGWAWRDEYGKWHSGDNR